MEILVISLIVALFLGYTNGANDNFKGVATLLGSKTANFRTSLSWATVTTALGSLAAFFIAHKLLISFSGKGLVPNEVAQSPLFSMSVGLGAALTVGFATRLGFPISTTHSLIGSLIGVGTIASTTGVHYNSLANKFLLPLLISPFLAIAFAIILYKSLVFIEKKSGITKKSCLCVGSKVIETAPAGLNTPSQFAAFSTISLTAGDKAYCVEKYQGAVLGIDLDRIVHFLHFLSSGAVSFARGLNDTPKIAALLLITGSLSPELGIFLVGFAIAIGGLLSSKRVAKTMSFKVTEMNSGQGFAANIVTSFLVIFASKLGMPVSTTHVSCGSLFGIGTANKRAHWKSIGQIVLAWVITLPIAALFASGTYWMLENIL